MFKMAQLITTATTRAIFIYGHSIIFHGTKKCGMPLLMAFLFFLWQKLVYWIYINRYLKNHCWSHRKNSTLKCLTLSAQFGWQFSWHCFIHSTGDERREWYKLISCQLFCSSKFLLFCSAQRANICPITH